MSSAAASGNSQLSRPASGEGRGAYIIVSANGPSIGPPAARSAPTSRLSGESAQADIGMSVPSKYSAKGSSTVSIHFCMGKPPSRSIIDRQRA